MDRTELYKVNSVVVNNLFMNLDNPFVQNVIICVKNAKIIVQHVQNVINYQIEL